MWSGLDLRPVGESTIKLKIIELINVFNLFMHGPYGKFDMTGMNEEFVPLKLISVLFKENWINWHEFAIKRVFF